MVLYGPFWYSINVEVTYIYVVDIPSSTWCIRLNLYKYEFSESLKQSQSMMVSMVSCITLIITYQGRGGILLIKTKDRTKKLLDDSSGLQPLRQTRRPGFGFKESKEPEDLNGLVYIAKFWLVDYRGEIRWQVFPS